MKVAVVGQPSVLRCGVALVLAEQDDTEIWQVADVANAARDGPHVLVSVAPTQRCLSSLAQVVRRETVPSARVEGSGMHPERPRVVAVVPPTKPAQFEQGVVDVSVPWDERAELLLCAVYGRESGGHSATATKAGLTRREVSVLELVAGGASTSSIAQELGISYKTVENHKQRIFAKFGVRNQAHAVAIAVREGLVSATALTAQPGDP